MPLLCCFSFFSRVWLYSWSLRCLSPEHLFLIPKRLPGEIRASAAFSPGMLESEVARGPPVPPPPHSRVGDSCVICRICLSCLNDVSRSPIWRGFKLAPTMAASFQSSLWQLLTKADGDLWIRCHCWRGRRGTDSWGRERRAERSRAIRGRSSASHCDIVFGTGVATQKVKQTVKCAACGGAAAPSRR